MAGPLVVWGEGHSLVIAPVTQAMEMNMRWIPAKSIYTAGPLGSIDDIPGNYTVETMLFLGPSTSVGCLPFACGANSAVRGFGQTLRKYKGKDTAFPAGGYAADPTLQYLGYCESRRGHQVHWTCKLVLIASLLRLAQPSVCPASKCTWVWMFSCFHCTDRFPLAEHAF
jgi:hypothetical protein